MSSTVAKKDSTAKMGEEKIPKLLLSYSLPVYVSYMTNSIYNVISRAFIGNSADGVSGLAAISVSFPVTMILLSFAFLFGLGGSTLAAIKVGEGDKKTANRVVNLSFQMLVIFSILYTIFGNIFLDKILLLFGASQEVLPGAMKYSRILLAGGIFQMIAVGMTNYMRVEGRTGLAMIAVFVGPIINIICSCLFILVFKWGMIGAGLATVCGQFANAMIILVHYFGKNALFRINKSVFQFDIKRSFEIMYLGLSSFAVNFCTSIVSIFLNRAARTYGGDIAVSGFGVVSTLMQLINTPISAVNMGWQALLGYNFGARKFDRIRELVRVGILGTTAIILVEFILVRIFPSQLISIFNSESQELIDFGSKALVTFLTALLLVPLQVLGSGFFQSIRKPILSVVLSLSRQLLILLPALFILPKFFGIDGVMYAGPVADTAAFLATLPFLIHYYRNLERIRG